MTAWATYKCDKCGTEQKSPDQFWVLGVTANLYNYTHNKEFVTGTSMHVCRPCLESFGVHVQKKPEDPSTPPPSVQERIKHILRELGVKMQGDD